MSTTQVPAGSNRFLAGDPLRGVGAIGVTAYHCALYAYLDIKQGPWLTPNLEYLFGAMAAQLYIFFVLSGYLITRPFVRWIILEGRKRPSFSLYARNRALRILPVFWLACLIAIIWHGTSGNSKAQLVALFGLGQVFTHGEQTGPMSYVAQGWSISVEVIFYTAVPIIAYLLVSALRGRGTPKQRAAAVLVLCAVVFVVSIWFRQHVSPGWARRLPWTVFYGFTPGIALAAIEPFAAPWLRSRKMSKTIPTILVVVGFGLMFYLKPNTQPILSGVQVALAAGLVVGGSLMRQWSTGDCWKLLDNRFFVWVGERSLSIYMLHLIIERPMLGVAKDWGVEPSRWALALLIIATLLVTFAAAEIMHRFVELPAMSRRKTTLQPAVVAPATT